MVFRFWRIRASNPFSEISRAGEKNTPPALFTMVNNASEPLHGRVHELIHLVAVTNVCVHPQGLVTRILDSLLCRGASLLVHLSEDDGSPPPPPAPSLASGPC